MCWCVYVVLECGVSVYVCLILECCVCGTRICGCVCYSEAVCVSSSMLCVILCVILEGGVCGTGKPWKGACVVLSTCVYVCVVLGHCVCIYLAVLVWRMCVVA